MPPKTKQKIISCLSKKNYANVQIQFSMWVQHCTDDLLFKRHQTCFCRIDRGWDNPPNRLLMSLGRPVLASQQMACPSRRPVFHVGLHLSVCPWMNLSAPSSSFRLTFKIYPGEKLFRSHTQYEKLFMAVRLLRACVLHEFLAFCLFICSRHLIFIFLPDLMLCIVK